METKKFLITSSYYPPYHVGGDAVHVKYLSEELVKLGHEVHVMFSLDAYRYKKKDSITLNAPEKSNGVSLHPLKSPLGKYDLYLTYLLGRSCYVEKRFGELLGEIKPDVVHHHNIFFFGYEILKKRRNYTNLYTAHDYWLICQRYDLMKYGQSGCKQKSCIFCILLSKRLPQIWRGGVRFRETLKDIDTIISPSNFMEEKLLEWLPVNVNIAHIPNFVPSPPRIIKDSDYSNYFLYVGVLESHKGLCNLLYTFKKHSKEIDSKLIVVGKGSLKGKINEYIAKNNLGNKIIVLGWVSDEMLWSLYKDAVALIVPSLWPENNPLVAIEAMSLGIPVIGSDVGGLGEIIKRINANFILKHDGLLNTLRMNASNETPQLREKIKQIYTSYYSPTGYLKAYTKLLG